MNDESRRALDMLFDIAEDSIAHGKLAEIEYYKTVAIVSAIDELRRVIERK